MRKTRSSKWLPVLMAISILTVAGFQAYWLKKSYERERRNLDMRTNMLFRETVRGVQAAKLDLVLDSLPRGLQKELVNVRHRRSNSKVTGMVDLLLERARKGGDSGVIHQRARHEQSLSQRQSRIIQFLFDVDSLQDSIRVKDIHAAYAGKLHENGLELDFVVSRVPTRDKPEPVYNEVTLGFRNPITYRLDLGNVFPLILQRLTVPILFSIFLVGFTILSFSLMYRNLVRQRRLAEIKNEFISNITHELKTPIATVSVAIEALKNFNANLDVKKTSEYLEISSNELQRLSLLVDKVLKLSMFENKEVELRYEQMDMKDLVEEVNASMRLQFEKKHADIRQQVQGDTRFEGDRLHLISVIFNLLDNALKYSPERPVINIDINGREEELQLSIQDAGIGIPAEYHQRIYEKFFRVPHGNLHNAKGYGLGLSYVSHVVGKHKGTIRVYSDNGSGTTFVITLPRNRVSKTEA